MTMREMKLKLTGTRPLMIQSERTANPLDPICKEIQKYTRKKPKEKTDADHAAVMRLEFEAAFYNGSEFKRVGPYIPGYNLAACLRDSAKSQRLGATVVRALEVSEAEVAIAYKGPRTIPELWKHEEFIDIRGVRPGAGKVMRCRPIFREWSVSATIQYEDKMLNPEKVMEIAQYAGKYVGLGNFRPTFGRFDVSVAK